MVYFNEESRKVYTGVIIFILVLHSFSMIVAIHNIIMYLCKARNSKLLINLFYFLIVIALGAKLAEGIYLLVERDNVFV